ncbi:uncharacterized protein LACBIDRAFT_300473 [Laccaria bicolor S238N-H82]|uniref:Predicted protein n=1 Tax=Laccaria bicolor (strain S238N-H82 / ATCC MYA-4686) TaxID=486041 RepID=B0DGV2_LACBS|nr:uncharacterized protein LACBIDRAFT_300473 [Laccaria bicolor S238N-H82]EDR06338.1 predicted protein [Laccaria bicolor S238N-H82]|eukprot:XP_001883199.1 predicted protein [Laccaria bicolor S238N-H82]
MRSHPCQAKCHTGTSPPCTIEITRPCRCGGTVHSLPCYEIQNSSPSDHPAEESEILCDRPCMVLCTCGIHQCRRVCCLLVSIASASVKKGKKRVGQGREMDMGLGLWKSWGACAMSWWEPSV